MAITKVSSTQTKNEDFPRILMARINNGTGSRSGIASATPTALALTGTKTYTAPADVNVDILFTVSTMTYRDTGVTRLRLHVNGVSQVMSTYAQGNAVWSTDTIQYKYQLNAGLTATWEVYWWQEGGGTASITNATGDTSFPNDVIALVIPRPT